MQGCGGVWGVQGCGVCRVVGYACRVVGCAGVWDMQGCGEWGVQGCVVGLHPFALGRLLQACSPTPALPLLWRCAAPGHLQHPHLPLHLQYRSRAPWRLLALQACLVQGPQGLLPGLAHSTPHSRLHRRACAAGGMPLPRAHLSRHEARLPCQAVLLASAVLHYQAQGFAVLAAFCRGACSLIG